ncbi:MAG TPA: hypothetical protein VGJ58_05870, partial [Gaiellaceae bacterium]
MTTGAPCVRGLGTSIAPRRRATFHQALLVAAAALSLVPPALAARPSVEARAYLVEDGRTGEVLLAKNP